MVLVNTNHPGCLSTPKTEWEVEEPAAALERALAAVGRNGGRPGR